MTTSRRLAPLLLPIGMVALLALVLVDGPAGGGANTDRHQ